MGSGGEEQQAILLSPGLGRHMREPSVGNCASKSVAPDLCAPWFVFVEDAKALVTDGRKPGGGPYLVVCGRMWLVSSVSMPQLACLHSPMAVQFVSGVCWDSRRLWQPSPAVREGQPRSLP